MLTNKPEDLFIQAIQVGDIALLINALRKKLKIDSGSTQGNADAKKKSKYLYVGPETLGKYKITLLAYLKSQTVKAPDEIIEIINQSSIKDSILKVIELTDIDENYNEKRTDSIMEAKTDVTEVQDIATIVANEVNVEDGKSSLMDSAEPKADTIIVLDVKQQIQKSIGSLEADRDEDLKELFPIQGKKDPDQIGDISLEDGTRNISTEEKDAEMVTNITIGDSFDKSRTESNEEKSDLDSRAESPTQPLQSSINSTDGNENPSVDQRILILKRDVLTPLAIFVKSQNTNGKFSEFITEINRLNTELKNIDDLPNYKLNINILINRLEDIKYTPVETKIKNFVIGILRAVFALPYLATRLVCGNKESKTWGDRPNPVVTWWTNGKRQNLFMYSDYKKYK